MFSGGNKHSMEPKKGPGPQPQPHIGIGIGIDLGTAYTRVAIFDGSQWRMIPDDHGNSAMPSYVAFTDSGVLVGESAKKQAPENPTNTIFDVIRLVGRRYSDPSVQNEMRLRPFKVRASPDDRLLVDVHWKNKLWHFTPVEICSMILMQMKENAETNLGAAIADAVITVPVHFNYEQRQAIKDAGTIAGLNFMQIISAPAASALFYGIERQMSKSLRSLGDWANSLILSKQEEHTMIIIDVGAGTVDVSLVTIKENMCKVRASAGNIHLGGLDFDNTMVYYFVNQLKKKVDADISNIPRDVSELRAVCEKIKIALSSGTDMVNMTIGPLYNNVNVNLAIKKEKFNELNNELFLKCVDIINTCLRDAKMDVDMVHEVILAGGSVRIPLLKGYIWQYFEGRKELNVSQHLETATTYGAAFEAFFWRVPENIRVRYLSLHDVTPFSLGIQSPQGTMTVFVPKNTNVPTKKECIFQFSNNKRQQPFHVTVYEGERKLAAGNNLLANFEFIVDGYDVNICFEIHEDGTLTVTAKEITSWGMIKKSKSITIKNHNIEDSRKQVWEALVYKRNEKCINKASTTKDIRRKWDRIKDKKTLAKLLTMDKVMSEKIMGHYIEPEEYAIGIDFGTTYSCVAVWRQNCVRIIENEYGSRLTCSSVAFTDAGRLIGDTVHKEQVTTNPANIIPNIKRLIGRCWSDQSVQNGRNFLPFSIKPGDKNRPMVSVQHKNEEKLFAPEEIAAMILSKMKEIVDAHLNSKVTKAVVSVPACFSDTQRQAIKDAGVIAGLNVMQLLNESTAVAIAYFFQKVDSGNSSEKTLLIFDLGGGNLDVSILTINEGTIKVRAVVGDTELGGEDINNNMVHHFVKKFMEEKKIDISNKPRSLRRLRAACEKAKRVLSTNAQTVVEIDALDEGIDFRSAITREAFEQLNVSLFTRSVGCVMRCLEDAKMDKSCIDEVVLVGGSTRIPKMQQLLQEFFNGKELCKSINADEAVVYGAAVRAAILSGNKDCEVFNILEIQDVTSWSFGLKSKDGTIKNVLIPKYTPILAKRELFTTSLDNLSSFPIQVQECELASSTVFNISDITPKPSGKSEISVSLEVDDSGILNLTAKDMREKNEKIAISKENGGLTTEEIHKMVEAAASFKLQDDEHKARAVALNDLENFAFKMKAIARDKSSSSSKSDSDTKLMEEEANKAIEWLETNHHAGIEEINAWKEKLEAIKSKAK